MNLEEMERYLREVASPLIEKLGDIVTTVTSYQKNEMSSELAMHQIVMILSEENR